MLWVPTRVVAWGVRLERVDRGGEKELPPFLFNKQQYLDLFEYLTNPLGMCSPPIPYISSYYKKESHGNGPKMLARGFEPKIS